MRSRLMLAAIAAAVGAGGCEPAEDFNQVRDAWLVRAHTEDSVRKAVVVQHTIYPCHFQPGGADLNELGMQDTRILADHYKKHPGKLNVRKGDADEKLYQARVEAVRAMLAERGVQTDRIDIANDLAGGEGMSSEQVLVILERAELYVEAGEPAPAPKRGGGQ